MGRVRTGVKHESRLARDYCAVRGEAGRDLRDDGMAHHVDGGELLCPVENETYGATRGARQRRNMSLEMEFAFSTEAATQVWHDDTHIALRNAKDIRESGTCDKWHLG